MAKLQLQSQIQLEKTSMSVETLIQELRFLNKDAYVSVFGNANLLLPRQLRMDVLRSLLESYVKNTRKERFTLADELNYRLKWFYQYSDFQYVNLLGYYENKKLNQNFIDQLLMSILEFLVTKKRENIIQELLEAKQQQSSPYNFKNIVEFNQALNAIFKDKKLEIDGLPMNLIRPVLFKSSTLQELKVFGEKYGIVVPRRLKKEQLLDVIFLELKSRGVLTEDLKLELKKKSVVLIQRYAIDHGIKVSTELKKDEIIEYILEFSRQTKSFYSYPTEGDYELEIDDPFEFEEVLESTEPQSESTEAQTKEIVSPIIPVETKKSKEKPQKNKVDSEPQSESTEPQTKEIVSPIIPVETKKSKEKPQKNKVDSEPQSESTEPQTKEIVSPIIPVETKKSKEKPQKNKVDSEPQNESTEPQSETKKPEVKTTQTQEDIVNSGGVPLVLDRETAKFLKLFAISQNQKLMILPDKNYNKKRRSFQVRFDQLGDVSKTKKKHGLIGELFILKFLGLIMLRTFLFLFAIALVLGIVFVGYATTSYFLNNETLNMINDQINSFEFLGKGILDHIFDFYLQIGI
jgi:hypothetical protein